MRILFETDFSSWTIGFALCRSKITNRICVLITLLCLGLLIMPRKELHK